MSGRLGESVPESSSDGARNGDEETGGGRVEPEGDKQGDKKEPPLRGSVTSDKSVKDVWSIVEADEHVDEEASERSSE